jgi:hypothetical protein
MKLAAWDMILSPTVYYQGFIDAVINPKSSSRPNKEERFLGSAHIPYMKVVSEKFSV